MATFVPKPSLPFASNSLQVVELSRFDSDLVRVLSDYLAQMARRANESVANDGSIDIVGNQTITGDLTVDNIIASGDIDAVNAAFTGTLAYNQGPVIVGTYTPTLTNTTNVAASTASLSLWERQGNQVTVFFQITVDPTLAAPTTTVIELSLPVASDIGSTVHLTGTATSIIAANSGAIINGSVANDRAVMTYSAGNTGNASWFGSFKYLVI